MADIRTKNIFTIEVNEEEAIELYNFLKLYAHNANLNDLEDVLRGELVRCHLID